MVKRLDKGLDLGFDAKRIGNRINEYAKKARNEEELKIKVESLIQELIAKFFEKGKEPEVAYEHRTTISGRREDALYGTVIIEYKAPKKLDTGSEFVKAKEQIEAYIKEEADGKPENFGTFFGVILDGHNISFVRFRRNQWVADEPTELSEESVYRLLEAIISLRRKAIDADFLLTDFGPESETSEKVISVLYDALEKSKSSRTEMLFRDWKRVFSQVCAYSPSKLEGLIEHYGVSKGKKVDVEKLMFAVHTYYTLVMKLLTSEVISFFNPVFGSPLQRIESAYYRSREDLRAELLDLEEGGIIAKIGIRNFLEADYFAWYLDEWSEDVVKGVMEIVRKLWDYDPATVELEPDRVKDLFKRLYQNLVPKRVRHDLGEYFTPDWLAELVLKEVEYDGNLARRALDPACGSGTFLVLAIKEAKNYAEEQLVTDKSELLRKIVRNVVGIDLNPLAVLASRANYVIALGDLIRYIPKGGIEIPVYLADSILVSRGISLYGQPEFVLETSVGKFWVREELINKELWGPLLDSIDFCLENNYSVENFKGYFQTLFAEKSIITKDAHGAAIRLYEKFLELEGKKLDKIWTKVIKNSFAPLLAGKFDYVVGNPPWINWESLPDSYKKPCMDIWSSYGLFPFKGWKGKLGGAKYDISMVFVYAAFDRYLKENGKLAFLITQSVFQSDAGYGFRKFYYTKGGKKEHFKIEKVSDLVEINPFEGATNRTSFFTATKGEETTYPVQYTKYGKKGSINAFAELPEALENIKDKELKLRAKPVKDLDRQSKWLIYTKEEALIPLQKVLGKSVYKGLTGCYTEGANGVFWVTMIERTSDNCLLVKNITKGLKKAVKELTLPIETDLVYPLLRGGEAKKWFAKPNLYIIFTSKHWKDKIKENNLKVNLSKTYSYLYKFRDVLDKRSSYSYKLKPQGYPFYTMYGSKKMLKPFKVVWQRMGSKLNASVISSLKNDYIEEKPIIPQETIIFVPFEDEKEAHYVCSVLNSSITEFVLRGYSMVGGKSFASAHVLTHIKVPKFNSKDKIHLKLAELSRKAHALAKRHYEQKDLEAQEELKEMEEGIDKIVAELYGITGDELEEVKKTLRVLKGEDV